MPPRFTNHTEAGRALAERLATLPLAPPVVVLALPRGGVPVAAEVARRLHAPLDLVLVRKIGAPGQPELAVAAVVDGDPPDTVVDPDTARFAGMAADEIDRAARAEWPELARRRALYLAGRTPVPVAGATVLLVDDGIATGTSVRAAIRALRRRGPAAVVVAVPVAPPDTVAALQAEADRVVCLRQPEDFVAVGAHYRDFHQLADAEVLALLQAAPA